MTDTEVLKEKLCARVLASDQPRTVLKAPELKALYGEIKNVPNEQRAAFGQKVNAVREAVQAAVEQREDTLAVTDKPSIDVTAPTDVNSTKPATLPATQGTMHPLTAEIETLVAIFNRMGYVAEESRQIDDQYHMFESLNFPAGHPARDDYDTFMTEELDADGHPLIAPAHTSTMQNRILRKYADNLERGEAIAAIVPDRVFRNEDLDATHEHTFYQIEGVYVAKHVTVGNLVATLKAFLQEYYNQELDVRVNPFYFPFTEPSFEFSIRSPYGDAKDDDWIELLGCGMIHPNVLRAADIDPEEYAGFAFGCGVDRLVMMKNRIEDVRHFESGKLNFLRQF